MAKPKGDGVLKRSQFASMQAELRAMPADQRAETIIETFKIASAEWAAMVLEHVASPQGEPRPPLPNDEHPIRRQLRDLDIEARCAFLGALLNEVCSEFAALIADSKGTAQ
jgi:hypothetical protein